MENRIVTAVFKGSKNTKVSDVWQWDYGQVLRIQGLDLPTAVEVDFAVAGASESIARIGTTKDGVTDVVIPDSLIETGKNLVAYIYLRDSASGNTEYQIDMLVTKRAKPEAYDRPEDKELFGQAIEAVNTAADRAEKARQTAQEAAQKAGLDAEQTAQDRVEVAKMVETVTDISEQVKKVEDLSNKAQAAATKTEADAQQTAEDRVEVGKILETVKDVSEQVKTVDESVRKAKESERAAEGHRTAVEEMKNSVEQTVSGITQVVQTGVQEINSAKQSAVQEVAQTGTAQKTAVEGAGTQAVENVENVKQTATEAVETTKTEAVQSVQTEGTKQTGNVSAEGAKQIKEVQDKGAEVLQSIPEDFVTQMETKLNKQQGIENKGKALVIGEDGNVAPGEVQSGGGDGIAIINTMSGESPLVIPDSAERVNKRLELGGKTEQLTTTGKNLLEEKLSAFTITNDIAHIPLPEDHNEKQYTMLIQLKDSKKDTVGFSCGFYDKTDMSLAYKSPCLEGGKIVSSNGIVVSKKGVNHHVCFTPASEDFFNIYHVIYTEGNLTSLPYEPYTGGKPSPSQEYQQEVKNAGKWNEETQKYEVDVKITNAEQNWIKEQTLTITSDRPITKWDRLVEQGGQIGWLYGTKKYTVTGNEVFESRDGYNIESYTNRYFILNDLLMENDALKPLAYMKCLRNVQYVYSANIFKEGFETNKNQFHIKLSNDRVGILASDDHAVRTDKFSGYMKKIHKNGNPIEILYATTDTVFLPLPQSEQNAIRALTTYYPTTVITVDGGELDPDIKVTYTADTKNYIDNKVSAKVASIIRQYRLNTANLLSLMPMETQAAMIENDTNNILENAEEMKHE